MTLASALRIQRAINAKRDQHRQGVIITTAAVDFLNGGTPTFARAFDRHGVKLWSARRRTDEPWKAFCSRMKEEAAEVAGVRSLTIGGLPDEALDMSGAEKFLAADVPLGAIVLPDAVRVFHPSQVEAFDLIRNNRRVVLVCGRRWGKSVTLTALAIDTALCGQRCGLFAPTKTLMKPLLDDISSALRSIPGVTINRSLGAAEIRLPNGGHVDFWSIDYTGRAGRGRKYHRVLIDEAAHDEGYLKDAFPAAIVATTLDYGGSIIEASTPNGVSPDNHFWQAAHLSELDFVVHHAPTKANPILSAERIAELRAQMPRPEFASQELDALFISLEGMSIFDLASLLIDGQPAPDHGQIDTIGVVIDSAAGETGIEHDGTAAIVFGMRHPRVGQYGIAGGEVVILDWDIRSLALGDVAAWLRHVNGLYQACIQRARPRMGLDGFRIEKPAMGLRLLELADQMRIPAAALNTEWLEWGKTGRALASSPHVKAGRVKFAKYAYEKRLMYAGAQYNHAIAQIVGFKTFDKKSAKRADDLADCFMYAILRCLGDGRSALWDRLRRS